uniref:Sorting nexin 12 n=1 Tax=Zosterops lateralis melanops TaxID=1220523 RepID=A0A8D2NTE3_ZOSLA
WLRTVAEARFLHLVLPWRWFQLHVGIRCGIQSNLQINCFASLQTNLPIFKLKESCVRRRYSDFEWLKNELERDSKIVVPPLPGKALKRQLPFRGDEGIFEESFIEERRQGLEQFINKIAGHPLAQNERCLHMFLQEETIDRNYVPGKVRQ